MTPHKQGQGTLEVTLDNFMEKPGKVIKSWVEDMSDETFEANRSVLSQDPRKVVQNIIKAKAKKIEKAKAESLRMVKMFAYENDLKAKGYSGIVGIDEAGRGPLVGDVVAAVAMIREEDHWEGINDSKKLTEDQRNYFYDRIIKEAVCYGIGVATSREIDDINILNATKLAMKRAIEQASQTAKIDFLLIDAVKLDDIPIEQMNLVKGDEKSASIAAASILAKVTRDKSMKDLHEKYPKYGFDQNKGYGTEKHYKALNAFGETPDHRKSFLVKWHAQK